MLIYFSGTGNTKHVADRIKNNGEEIINIETLNQSMPGKFKVTDDRIGILSPTYAAGLPTIMREFLEQSEFEFSKKPYIFFIATCDGMPGVSGDMVSDIFDKKKIDLDATFYVTMPENYSPMFNVGDEAKNIETNRLADDTIDDIIIALEEKRTGNHIGTIMGKTAAKNIHTAFLDSRSTRKFKVNQDCISCGACERYCPIFAIELHFGIPEWVKNKCIMCMRCLNTCPTNAIEYGNSKGNGQYMHPDFKKKL